MKAVIIGSTGLVGSTLLVKLLNDSSIERVTSVTRTKCDIETPKLKEIIFNTIDDLENLKKELKGDLYFCCLGTTIKKAGSEESFKKVDHDGVLTFAKIAKKNEASSFVLVSASGANKDSKLFYPRVKGQTEEDLKALHLKNLVIMRPSLLIGERKEKRPLEEMAIKTYKMLSPILPKKLKVKAGTDVNVLADKMIDEAKKHVVGTKILEAGEITEA